MDEPLDLCRALYPDQEKLPLVLHMVGNKGVRKRCLLRPLERTFQHPGFEARNRIYPMQVVPVLGFPAMAVPTGIRNGLRCGVQPIGGRFQEDFLLHVAKAVENRATRSQRSLSRTQVG